MNIIHVAGRLGADPEVRFTSNGQKVTTLRMAVNSRKSGKDETIWYRITIWGENFDKMIAYFKKGSALMVVGELQKPEIFTDKSGQSQISMGIVASNLMFSPFGKGESSENKSPSQAKTQVKEDVEGFASGEAKEEIEDFQDDEIPF
ncbi:MAG: hypothetical protein A3F40_01340 [Chlamydiae bacterium RIFCSPHIGHO2_12_FULL_27_8]|nr:MAG: hypothetical protein A3F40_01340 [Chlamydiae bacterium RIFCSPHIGHO2_12_FULL_27_8]